MERLSRLIHDENPRNMFSILNFLLTRARKRRIYKTTEIWLIEFYSSVEKGFRRTVRAYCVEIP